VAGRLPERRFLILSAVLILQAAMFYGVSRRESVPASRPLREFPTQLRDWTMVQEGVIEKEVQEVLKADDALTRTYVNSQIRSPANLFVAYFRTQQTGQAPHSPKNCLPGSGWAPLRSDTLAVPVAETAGSITVNRYVVGKGDEKSLVLYWYQTPHRVVASEYAAKIYLVADSIRYRRSDTALVRIVVPVVAGDEDAATRAAVSMAQSAFPALRQHLPA
jgi:EpsI family protein